MGANNNQKRIQLENWHKMAERHGAVAEMEHGDRYGVMTGGKEHTKASSEKERGKKQVWH